MNTCNGVANNFADTFKASVEEQQIQLTNTLNIPLAPQEVVNRLMNLDIVQDVMTETMCMASSIESIVKTCMSMEAPGSLKAAMRLIRTVRGLISEVKRIKNDVTETSNIIKDFSRKD